MLTLTIIIPFYNEKDRIGKAIDALLKWQIPRGLKLEKIIFVNDGSTDNTLLVIKNMLSESDKQSITNHIQVISYKTNLGKGHAVRKGMLAANSDYTLFCDADMSTHINEIKKFLPFMRKQIPIIIGTRKNGHSTVIRHQPFFRELMGKVFTRLSNIVLNTSVSDFTCGFKAFSKDAKDTLFPMTKINGWSFDPEIIFLGRLNGFSFVEIPVIWSDDRMTKVNLLKDASRSFFDLFYIRFFSLRPHPFIK